MISVKNAIFQLQVMQSLPPAAELVQNQASCWLGGTPSSVQEQTGGLSGTRVWRVDSSRGTFALRQYPVEFPTVERLRWLHGFLKEAQDRGCTLLPCPLATRDGSTWIEQDSHYWEMLTWVQGEPLLETNPSREMLITGAETLAKLHLQLSRIHFECKPAFGWPTMHAEGPRQRLELLQKWNSHDEMLLVERFAQNIEYAPLLGLFAQLRHLINKYQQPLLDRLSEACSAIVPIFPVLRDVQPAHVIFHSSRVAGFIDVAAMRYDSPMADLARLLHRWRFAEPEWYATALGTYQNIRAFHENEQCVLEAYDYSARLLTGVQWLRWLVLEQREFANSQLVNQHLERVLRELKFLQTHDFGSV